MPGSGIWGRTPPPPGSSINRAHPLARNLSRCWLLGWGGTRIQELARGPDTIAVTGSPLVTGTAVGPGITFDASTKFGTVAWVMPPTWSMECWLNPASGHATALAPILTNPGTLHGFYVNHDASDNCAFEYYNGGSQQTTAGTVPKDQLVHLVMTYDLVAYRFYINGIPYPQAIHASPAQTLTIIGYSAGVTWPLFATLPVLRLWDNRVLDQFSIEQLYASPFDMFSAPVWRRYFIPAVGGALPPGLGPSMGMQPDLTLPMGW